MGLGRRIARRLHRTAVDTSVYWKFAPGTKVMTIEGFPGVVDEVSDGPYPDTEAYIVTLDNGLGGGEYSASELRAIPTNTAAANVVGQSAKLVDADLDGTAAIDYPELGEVLVTRPPLVHAVVGAKLAIPDRIEPFDCTQLVDYALAELAKPAMRSEWKGNMLCRVCNSNMSSDGEGAPCSDCSMQTTAMRTEDYRGVKIKLKKGKGNDWGSTLCLINGHDYSYREMDEEKVLSYIRGTIDDAIARPDRYEDMWRPGHKGVRDPSAWQGHRCESSKTADTKIMCRYCGAYKTPKRDAAGLWECRDCGEPMECDNCGQTMTGGHQCPDPSKLAVKIAGWIVVDDGGMIHAGPFVNSYQADEALTGLLEDPNGDKYQFSIQRQTDADYSDPFAHTAGVLDHVIDWAADRARVTPGNNWSYDWCRFRKHQRCMYPKQLDPEGTKEAGYAVWVPEDRGFCPRQTWDQQKLCPVGEPGPHSGEPDAKSDATVSWSEGGQRVSIRHTAGQFHCPGTRTKPLPSVDDDLLERKTTHNNVTRYHPADYGVCPVCNEPRKTLKDGTLAKHTRYLSWKTQQEMRARGEDPDNPKTAATVISPNEPVEQQGMLCPYCFGAGYGGVLAVARANDVCGKCTGRGFLDIKFKFGTKTSGFITFDEEALYQMLGELALPPWPDGEGGYLGGNVDCAPLASDIIDRIETTRVGVRRGDGTNTCTVCGSEELHGTEDTEEYPGEWVIICNNCGHIQGKRRKKSSLEDHEWLFHVTSRWSDVRAKASRIRKEGHVRIISATASVVTAEVRGDSNVYQTSIMRLPGSKSAAMWECGCAWANYSWARSGRWKKYEGRMCAHALALVFEVQAQEMFGKGITEEQGVPQWRSDPTIPVVVPGDYRTKPGKWRVNAALVITATKQYTVVGPIGAPGRKDFELHIAGCGDLAQPKYQRYRSEMHDLDADSWQDAADQWIDADLQEMGYSVDEHVQVFPCAKRGVPEPKKELDPSLCPGTGQAIDNPTRRMYLPCPVCGQSLGTGRGVVPRHKRQTEFVYGDVKNPDDPYKYSKHIARRGTRGAALCGAGNIEYGGKDLKGDPVRGMCPTCIELWQQSMSKESAYLVEDDLRESGRAAIAADPELAAKAELYEQRRARYLEETAHEVSTDASLHPSMYEVLLKEAGFGGVLKAKVRGVVRRILDLLPGNKVQVDGVGAVDAREVIYPTYDPRAGLDPRDLTASMRIVSGDEARTGVMVALVPPREYSQSLIDVLASANPDAEPQDIEEAHITLTFNGKTSDVDEERLAQVCAAFALGAKPLTGKVSGFGHFDTPEGFVAVALWDIPGLDEWRTRLVQTLNDADIFVADNHSYTPHQSLSYGDTTQTIPALPDDAKKTIDFESFVTSYGPQWTTYEMGNGEAVIGENKAASTSASGEWHNSDGYSEDATTPQLVEHMLTDHHYLTETIGRDKNQTPKEIIDLFQDHVDIPWDPYDRDFFDDLHAKDHSLHGECGAHEGPDEYKRKTSGLQRVGGFWDLQTERGRDLANGEDRCELCGRKLNTETMRDIELDLSGRVIPEGHPDSGGPESQGAFLIGPECLKKVNKEVEKRAAKTAHWHYPPESEALFDQASQTMSEAQRLAQWVDDGCGLDPNPNGSTELAYALEHQGVATQGDVAVVWRRGSHSSAGRVETQGSGGLGDRGRDHGDRGRGALPGGARGRDGLGRLHPEPGRGPRRHLAVEEPTPRTAFGVRVRKAAQGDYVKLSKADQKAVNRAVSALKHSDMPQGARGLTARLSGYRAVHVGDSLRVLYGVSGRLITVYAVGQRENFYDLGIRRIFGTLSDALFESVTSTLHDEPEPALPTTDGADDDADEDLEAIHEALVSGVDIELTNGLEVGHLEQSSEIRGNPRPERHISTYDGASAGALTTTSAPGVPSDVALPAWLNPDAAASGADRVAQSRAANSEIASMAKLYLEQGPEALTAVAMKNYSAAEQAEIINEGEGQRADNLDALDLSGTHYTALMLDDDEETWLS